MNKNILLTIGIVVIVGAALVLVFWEKGQRGAEENSGFSFGDFLPFGRSDNFEPNPSQDSGTGAETESSQNIGEAPRLRKISKEPVAGAVAFNQGSTTIIRFVEKGTGNVYEANSLDNSIKRLTNTTIPKIVRAFWLPNGSGFLAQTLVAETEVIETSFVKLTTNTATSSEESTPFATTIAKLPTGIKELSVKPDSKKIFYYTIDGAVSRWFTSNPDGTEAIEITSHPITEWSVVWVSGDVVEMQTKRSGEAASYSYSLNTKTKNLVSKTDDSLRLAAQARTLAEKCVWETGEKKIAYCAIPKQIPQGSPDSWYMGTASTEDSIEKIDAENTVFYRIADLSNLSDEKIDVVDIALSPDQSHLIFRNKIDGYLWALKIEE